MGVGFLGLGIRGFRVRVSGLGSRVKDLAGSESRDWGYGILGFGT